MDSDPPSDPELLNIDMRKSDLQDLNGSDAIVPVNNADYVGIPNVGHREHS